MKKRQLKIQLSLFMVLIVLLCGLSVIYVALIRGKGFHQINLDVETLQTTDVQNEPTTEPIVISPIVPNNKTPIFDIEGWKEYSPTDNLSTDNWSLTLINSNFKLIEKYSPNLMPIIDGSAYMADERIVDAYKQMYNDALAQDILLTPCGGYNSYHRQIEVYKEKVSVFVNSGYTKENAELEAAKRVGKPCCNESGAGLSVGIKQMSADFASSKEYSWLIENAHNYGFVLRYPEDKTNVTGMTYQPWLWRYVGVEIATEMKEKNLCLEEYLGYAKYE